MSAVKVCDLCGSNKIVSSYKVKRGYGTKPLMRFWERIDICERCWKVLHFALYTADKGMKIDHVDDFRSVFEQTVTQTN